MQADAAQVAADGVLEEFNNAFVAALLALAEGQLLTAFENYKQLATFAAGMVSPAQPSAASRRNTRAARDGPSSGSSSSRTAPAQPDNPFVEVNMFFSFVFAALRSLLQHNSCLRTTGVTATLAAGDRRALLPVHDA